jgi:hypothetical protein
MNNNRYRCVISGVCTPPVNSAGAILTVNALPTVSVTPAAGCGGVPGINGLLLTASGANNYTWSPLAGLFTNAIATTAYTGGNTPTVYAAPSTFTAYTVTGTNAATGCSNTATALINYTPPAPAITPSSVAMCLGNPAVRLVSSSAIASTRATWSPIAGLFTDPAALNAYTGTPTDTVYTMPTPSGVYPYTATVQSVSLPPAEIATTFTNNNAFALVTSNFTNNNAFPVTITGIESVASASGGSTARLYYKTSAIAGAPGAISAANGWVLSGTGTYTAVANTTTTTPQPMLSGVSLVIPPGATYGLAFESQLTGGAGNLRYSTVAAGTYINSGGGCDLTSGTNVSFAGDLAPLAPINTPRAFIGKVLFSGFNAAPCTSPVRTVVVTVNQPTTVTAQPVDRIICSDKLTTFAVTAGGTGPFSYQWQVSSNGGITYNPVSNGTVYSGATTATLTITQPPVTMSGYFYRCVITGAAPCASVTSAPRRLTVNPLPTVIITAAPYIKLFPGLVTTISSTVTPNGAAPGGYTWLRNGAPVAGANSGTLSVDVDRLGDYRLTVTDVNGCTSTSNLVSISDSITGKCYIYPNPNSGQFQVRYYSAANNVLPRTLTVYDGKGNRVLTQLYTIGRPYDRMDVDLRKNGKGLYWVEIGDRNGNRLTMCRVVIQ